MIYNCIIHSWFETKLIDYQTYNVVHETFIFKIMFELENK